MNSKIDSTLDTTSVLSSLRYLSTKESREISKHVNYLVEHLSRSISSDRFVNYSLFDNHCKALQSIIKNIAKEDNLEKMVEADSLLVGLSSQLEDCRNHSKAHTQNVVNFIKQMDSLSAIKEFCDYYKSYKNYEIVMKTSPQGVRGCERYNLPEDNVYRCFNSNISSLRAMIQANLAPSEYDNLIYTRINILNRAKMLYMKRQIPLMKEFSQKNPDNTLSYAFSLNCTGIEKNIETLLAKNASLLEISPDTLKEQTQNNQHTKDQSNGKKTKSAPDIER